MTTTTTRSFPRTRFSVLGAGRVGTALARGLCGSPGFRLFGFSCRSRRSLRAASRRIRRGTPFRNNRDAVGPSTLVLISVPDRQIGPLARELAETDLPWKGRTVLHTSGALDSTILKPLGNRGAQVGSFHPLQTFTGSPREEALLVDCPLFLEGDRIALRLGRFAARALGGRPVRIPTHLKTAYHLSACLLSNYLICLVSIGLDLVSPPYRTGPEWLPLYLPLMERTLRNLREHGAAGALTGPVSRGDGPTLRRHLRLLEQAPGELATLHRVLALRAVRLARSSGRIRPGTASYLRRLLRGGPA